MCFSNKYTNGRINIFRNRYIFCSILFGILWFVFFAFFYQYHLHYYEQLQLFLFTDDYFRETVIHPGGLNALISHFLMQLFYIPFAGAAIVALLLTAIQLISAKLLKMVNDSTILYPLSFIPSVITGFILCNEFFTLAVATGFCAATTAGYLYIKSSHRKNKIINGSITILLSYLLLGGAYFTTLSIILFYEIFGLFIKHNEHTHSSDNGPKIPKNITILAIISNLVVAIIIPLIFRNFIFLNNYTSAFVSDYFYRIHSVCPNILIVLAFIPSFLLSICYIIRLKDITNRNILFSCQIIFILLAGVFCACKYVNLKAEKTMAYDYFVRNRNYEKAIRYAEKHIPENYLSLAMVNMSLSEEDRMSDEMFLFGQHGSKGLFVGRRLDFFTPMTGNEILFHVGLVNASQEYTFESMELIPGMTKSARAFKRLAETNLINGQYDVAEKYLNILSHTLFYRQWAKDTRTCLNNEQKINEHPVWGRIRKYRMDKDIFFSIENIETNLLILLRENPDNKIAFEYLMAYYLLNKRLDDFINALPNIKNLDYKELPLSYQEAVILYMSYTHINPLEGSNFTINNKVISKFRGYTKIFRSNNTRRQHLLHEKYSGTYWYYFHYNKDVIPNTASLSNP